MSNYNFYLLCIASGLYLLGVQAPTIRFNIPLNNELQRLDISNSDEPRQKRHARQRSKAAIKSLRINRSRNYSSRIIGNCCIYSFTNLLFVRFIRIILGRYSDYICCYFCSFKSDMFLIIDCYFISANITLVTTL